MPTPGALRPYAHPGYRVVIAALAISIFGSGMWAVARVYQVIQLGGGPLELSLVATAGSVGLLAFLLADGIAADRITQRRLTIALEGANLAVIAAGTGHGRVAATLASGCGRLRPQRWRGFLIPRYAGILPRILPAKDLLPANGVEGSMRPVLQQAANPAVAGSGWRPSRRRCRDGGGGVPPLGLHCPQLPGPALAGHPPQWGGRRPLAAGAE